MTWYVDNNGEELSVRARNVRDQDDALKLVAAIQANIPLLAQGIEAATAAETVELGSVHESPVGGNADAPKGESRG